MGSPNQEKSSKFGSCIRNFEPQDLPKAKRGPFRGSWVTQVPNASRTPCMVSQPRAQRKNLNLRSVETTRPLRGIALTDADTQEATVRACHSANPGIIIVCIPRSFSEPPWVLHGAVATRARCPTHHDVDRLRGDTRSSSWR